MSNRPTPETDAQGFGDGRHPWVGTDFARKLERERDEAREERDKLQVMRKEVVAANKGAKINAQVSNSLAGKLNQAERERDEALELLASEKITRNHIIKRSVEVERERDEARTERDILRLDAQREAEQHDRMVGELEKIYDERDEARESLKHITEYGTEEINAAVELRQKLASALVERDEAREESLEQARLLGISGERECRIIAERDEARREILGWENKWRAAIEMAAIAENEHDLLKEELINLEDQRDLAMKVIKRLEAQLAQK